MGSFQSKQESGMRRVPSHSVAFGRLRIDSPSATPGSGHRHTTMRQRKSRRTEDHQHDGHFGHSSPKSTFPTSGSFHKLPVETSPLLAPPQGHQDRMLAHGKPTFESIDSMDSTITQAGSPPLSVWIVPALCCALAYALYNIFIKKGSYHISPVLGGVILQLVAALLGSCLLGVLIAKEGYDEVVIYNAEGIQWAILAGIAVGTAEIVSFFVSSLGVQAMQSIPIIIGGSVMFGTVLGAVALHEALTYRGWGGVLMISIGIGLVGMDDPGEGSPE